jgi:vacuolar-type H+-ATPase subunit I/STV1
MMAEMTELSTSKELEELGSKKAVLEAESRSLKEEQQSLAERIKVLEEEIVIEQLKNDNRTAREAISRLKSKKDELEQRLKETSRTPETESTTEAETGILNAPGPKAESAVGIAEAGTEETEEDVVTVMPLESPMTNEPEKYNEDIKKQQEKKKRKFL